MLVRVAFSVALLIAASAPAAFAAPQATVMGFTFACPSVGVTNEHNAIWKKKSYDAASASAKANGCTPFLAS